MIDRIELIPFSDDVIVTTTCPVCGKSHELRVNHEALERYMYEGVLVQNAFPELSPEERELLITGIDAACWIDTFTEGGSNE